jgi:hypothetical protein
MFHFNPPLEYWRLNNGCHSKICHDHLAPQLYLDTEKCRIIQQKTGNHFFSFFEDSLVF